MNYLEARAFLREKASLGSIYGLKTIKELLRRLGDPQKALSCIHVAGTNGKGSTIAFADSILRTEGYRVGCYNSPAVFSYEEIIRVGGDPISKEAVAKLLTQIREVSKEMESDGFAHPTVFEMETAMAFAYFQEMSCDLVFIECGLGGREDATNVIDAPLVAAFASISRDHMGILGNTISEIAREKAGIIKDNVSVVSTCQEEEAAKVLAEVTRQKGGQLTFACVNDSEVFSDISLQGDYQKENAALAVAIIKELEIKGYPVSKESIKCGLKQTKWPGRLQKISDTPEFYIDGAHNEGAINRLAEFVKLYFTNRRICYIMGVFRDKEYEKILENMAPYTQCLVTVTAPGTRGLEAAKLAQCATKWYSDITAANDYETAIQIAKQKAGQTGVVFAFGSLSYLGEVAKLLAGENEDGK